jgi:hypothetical protein
VPGTPARVLAPNHGHRIGPADAAASPRWSWARSADRAKSGLTLRLPALWWRNLAIRRAACSALRPYLPRPPSPSGIGHRRGQGRRAPAAHRSLQNGPFVFQALGQGVRRPYARILPSGSCQLMPASGARPERRVGATLHSVRRGTIRPAPLPPAPQFPVAHCNDRNWGMGCHRHRLNRSAAERLGRVKTMLTVPATSSCDGSARTARAADGVTGTGKSPGPRPHTWKIEALAVRRF